MKGLPELWTLAAPLAAFDKTALLDEPGKDDPVRLDNPLGLSGPMGAKALVVPVKGRMIVAQVGKIAINEFT